MASLKQELKKIVIEHQHRIYNEEVNLKKTVYDSWIRLQETKLNKNTSVICEKLKNRTGWQGAQEQKQDNAGDSIFKLYDKKNRSGKKFTVTQIHYYTHEQISGNRLKQISTDFVLFCLEPGEVSNITWPLLYRALCENENLCIIYGDEDVQKGHERSRPWFKPDWSPDTFRSFFYFGSFIAVSGPALKKVLSGRIPQGIEYGIFLYTVIDRIIAENGGFALRRGNGAVLHISEVLYHAEKEGYREVSNWGTLKSLSGGRLSAGNALKISIIIPSKDNPEVLLKCIHSVIDRTTGGLNYEIVLVDNGSSEENRKLIKKEFEAINKMQMQQNIGFGGCRYVYRPMIFNFSDMCNLGAEEACGSVYLFLNDDMEIIQADWLLLLADKVLLPYAGAVGAKLLYPDSDMIQHAGITNLRVGPAHKLQFLSDSESLYYGKNRGVHNMMAVTGACLMVRKSVFEQAGGFCSKLAVAFNDVDLCYTIHEMGYYNIVRNDVVLYHHESLSRGKDGESEEKQLRLAGEKDLLYERHRDCYGFDMFYHKYLTNDMVESEYAPAFHYEITADMPWSVLYRDNKRLKRAREDKCLVIGMECAMDLYKWTYGVEAEKGIIPIKPDERGYYFQGYSFVIGADNACYKKTLLLRNEDAGEIYLIPLDTRYRQDIKNNLKDQLNVDLTGFAAKVQTCRIPVGTYHFGMLAEERYSRQKLVNWSNWVLEVR